MAGSIVDYSSLQTAMSNWLSHTLHSARYPDFIELFEAWANRKLRTQFQETTVDLTASNGVCTLPSDYLEAIRVTRLSAIPQDMQYVNPAYLQIIYPDQTQIIFPPQRRVPTGFYTIETSSLKVRPKDDSSQVELFYYAKIPALSNSNTTNWLLTSHPDLYLYGSLVEVQMYAVNVDKAGLWKMRRDELMQELVEMSKAARQGVAMAMQTQNRTP